MKNNLCNQEKMSPDHYAKDFRPHIIPEPRKIQIGDDLIDLKDFIFNARNVSECIAAGLYQEAFSFGKSSGKHFNLVSTDSVPQEAYNISIQKDKIIIEASGDCGFFHAFQTLKQLETCNHVPLAEVEDYPRLGMRGFHFNLGTMKMLKFENVKDIIRMMGKFKMNTLLLEYTDIFPFERHSCISSADAFSREQIHELELLAKENYVEIIPLVQSLGHMRHVLRNPEYRHLLEEELPENLLLREQFCPLNQGAFELFTEMAEEILQAHPKGKYLHIGADETSSLGQCPACADFVKKEGKSKLYIDYINKVCSWVKTQNRIPILWDDMICHYPEVINRLDHDAVIMCWDYWTTAEKSPIFLARGAGFGLVHDKRWNSVWHDELREPEKSIVANFSKALDFEKDLAPEYLKSYRKYLGSDFPKYINAFPNIRFFKDCGFSVIGAPTTLGNRFDDTFGLPNYNRFLANIREFSNTCLSENISGMITTSWYNFPCEILVLGIIATAHFSWHGGKK